MRPGAPISIVLNPASKRKDPALVGFTADNERVLGDNALMAVCTWSFMPTHEL